MRFTGKYADAIPEYDQYLQLSDFNRKPASHTLLWRLAFMTRAKKAGSVAELSPVLNHSSKCRPSNRDLEQAGIARKNVTALQEYFRRP